MKSYTTTSKFPSMIKSAIRLSDDANHLASSMKKLESELMAARVEAKVLRQALEKIADTDPDKDIDWFHKIATVSYTHLTLPTIYSV